MRPLIGKLGDQMVCRNRVRVLFERILSHGVTRRTRGKPNISLADQTLELSSRAGTEGD